MAGKLIGIGVGPGDPELLTVKAVKALRMADVVSVPKAHSDVSSLALGAVRQILEDRQDPPELLELVFPMTKDKSEIERVMARNASAVADRIDRGKVVAFITLGDPMFYSTFVYLFEAMRRHYPGVEIEIIPGVTSLTACAATARLPLAEREEVVAVIPSEVDKCEVEEISRHADSMVFMKCARRFKELVTVLKRSPFEKSTVAIVRRCSMPEERVVVGEVAEAEGWELPDDYFSMMIVKRRDAEKERGDVV
ncbi:MAG: precorrin-2 C(20)-methyltransferase [Candidatus Verstraetearchaeota archaeon]|nr:precorrin-2 C(20)-methyltransferase [Candidatus Verstraetearchaeota archaeon]